MLVFDFDGTLAPIVPRPADARVAMALARQLEALALRVPVAVITGRTVDDVLGRLRFTPHFVVGNHGAECPGMSTNTQLQRALEPVRQQLALHADALRAAGVTVEDKRFSISFHYRCAREPEQAQAQIRAMLQGAADNLRVFGGKHVVNVAASEAPNKADAVQQLALHAGVSSVVYVGDDVNDEEVFRRAPPHWLTIRLGRDDPQSCASYFLDSLMEMGGILNKMLQILGDVREPDRPLTRAMAG